MEQNRHGGWKRSAMIIAGLAVLAVALAVAGCRQGAKSTTSELPPWIAPSSGTPTAVPSTSPVSGTTLNPTQVVPGLVTLKPSPTPSPSPSPSPALPTGKDLFTLECAGCHGNPPRNALLQAGEAYAKGVINNGAGAMPGFAGKNANALTEAQVASLIEFLKSTPPVPPIGPFYPHAKPTAPCTSCHNADALGAPDPKLHTGMNDAMCAMCHFPALKPVAAVPHAQDVSECASCHAPGGSAPLPADHANRSASKCLGCHADWKVPPMGPHSSRWTQCGDCHKPGSTIAPPADHVASWADCANAACHGSLLRQTSN